MPCIPLPQFSPPQLPSPFTLGSLSLSTPVLSAQICCIQAELPSLGIILPLPPLGVVADAINETLSEGFDLLNAYIRSIRQPCPLD